MKTRQIWAFNNREKRRKRGRQLASTLKYQLVKKQYKARPEIIKRYNFLAAKRRAMKFKATPNWANLDKIKEIYLNCPKGFHVDHIIPLQSKKVCGLHVHNNLRIITAHQNQLKSNSLEF